jgi:dienelactone hydrolase
MFAMSMIWGIDQAAGEPPNTRAEIMAAHTFDKTYREALVSLPIVVRDVSGNDHTTEFQLTYVRPAGEGPFPLAIMHHGRGPDRSYPSRRRGDRIVSYFLRRGFAVLIPTRVGYGGLGGTIDIETGLRGCDEIGIEQQISSVRSHTLASLAFARAQAWADASRVMIAGASVGGYTSIAGTTHGVPGVIGVLNFAGGSGGSPKRSPMLPCRPERIEAAMARAGRAATVPSLWVYAENDKYWGPKHPRAWHSAYANAGGKAEFLMLPPYENDGHEVGSAVYLWRHTADAFLGSLGFKPPRTTDAPPASSFAKLDEITKLPVVGKTTVSGYERFLRTDLPRAFVLAPSGAWTYRSGQSLGLREALEQCRAVHKVECKAYAVDDDVVWTP